MTTAQRRRRAQALVAAAARAVRDDEGRPRPIPYAQIGRAIGLTGQRVKEIVEELRQELASKTAGDDFAAPTYRESFAAARTTRRKLRPARN